MYGLLLNYYANEGKLWGINIAEMVSVDTSSKNVKVKSLPPLNTFSIHEHKFICRGHEQYNG